MSAASAARKPALKTVAGADRIDDLNLRRRHGKNSRRPIDGERAIGAALDDDDGVRRQFALQAQRCFGRTGRPVSVVVSTSLKRAQ